MSMECASVKNAPKVLNTAEALNYHRPTARSNGQEGKPLPGFVVRQEADKLADLCTE
jgi:hypothetical protein